MKKQKQSFFQRLTGTLQDEGPFDDRFDQFEREPVVREKEEYFPQEQEQVEEEGQLTVDVFQTEDDIVVRSIVAGVKPEDLDISISRDMVTIRGRREEDHEVMDDAYFHRELYWGAFSRIITLPAEVEVDEAQASEKYGVLTIRIPKVNKDKQKKVRVTSGK
jgi:HSP20 family protein